MRHKIHNINININKIIKLHTKKKKFFYLNFSFEFFRMFYSIYFLFLIMYCVLYCELKFLLSLIYNEKMKNVKIITYEIFQIINRK